MTMGERIYLIAKMGFAFCLNHGVSGSLPFGFALSSMEGTSYYSKQVARIKHACPAQNLETITSCASIEKDAETICS
jgi:hypothetical protein